MILRGGPATGANGAAPPGSGGERTALWRGWLHRSPNARGNTLGQLAQLLLFGLALLLALGAAVAPWKVVSRVDLPVGSVADRTLKAPHRLTYVSEARTQEKRDEAANDERNRVWARDAGASARQQAQLDAVLRILGEIRTGSGSLDDRVRAAQSAVDGLSSEDAQQLLTLSNERWLAVTDAARQLLDNAMQQQIRAEDLARVKEDLRDREVSGVSPLERGLAVALARPFVRPTMVEDAEKTAQNREAARERVDPVSVTIQEGQTVVREGDIVTRDAREQAERLGLLQPRIRWPALLGTLGLIAMLVLLLLSYLYQFNREVWHSRQLVLLGLTIALPVIAARLLLSAQPLWVYAFPVAIAAMLTTVLLNLELATVVAMMVSICLGLLGGATGGSLEYMVLAFVASLVGAYILWQADRIATFLYAGVGVTLAAFAVGVCFQVLAGTLDWVGVAQLALLAAFNGGLAAILTFGSFSFLGGLFGITTHLQLLELAHPNQPLLYKLAREAPGTYHHSIVVSNLAESAVELVGGDPLFARVAVLYHDIGKTLRPTFFIENQAHRDNVHDALDPHTSARIILDHVTDGVRLGRKARLPQAIVDVIQQHHGTTILRYFYNKALENGDDVREEDFRYPGPRPQTKEAGVIMLADSVEATVRAAAQSGRLRFQDEPKGQGGGARRGPSRPGSGSFTLDQPTTLQQLVVQVIDDLVKRGQLDECALTLRDIDLIKRTFVQVLDGIYHPRIEYPTAPAPRHAEEPAPTTVG